jgi:cytochrome P450
MSSGIPCGHGFDFHGDSLDEIFDEYSRLLSECPVGYSENYGGFWFLTRYADVHSAEQDPRTFSVAPTMLLPPLGTDRPMIPIDIDPPAHPRYRKILLPYFTPSRIDRLEPGTREQARELISSIPTSGGFDASAAFARPMPSLVFCRFAGFPTEDAERFDVWIDRIFYRRTTDPADAQAAADDVYAYFRDLLEERRNAPHIDDLIGGLLAAEIDGRPLTDDELLNFIYTLFVAGLDTTAWTIRSSLWHLAQHPQDRRRLREDPSLIPGAVEEFLRTLSPVQAMARTVTRDVDMDGHRVKEAERVVLVFGAANRDPEEFPAPDAIRIDREENRHLAFGVGIHRCIGSNLGRLEVKVALEEFLAAFSDFELAGESPWHGVGPLPLTVRGG